MGTADELAKTIGNDLNEIEVTAYSSGSTLCVLRMEESIGIRSIVNNVMSHNGKGMSPGDYVLLFIMNRLSDPESKSGIERWMQRDYASTVYPKKGSQDFWNFMDRINDEHVDKIMKALRKKGHGYRLRFLQDICGCIKYVYIHGGNDVAKRGHNKEHRYDLN
ncbi:MAG: hypothetical protein QXJ24_05905 [Thermoplasmatales archaeon]